MAGLHASDDQGRALTAHAEWQKWSKAGGPFAYWEWCDARDRLAVLEGRALDGMATEGPELLKLRALLKPPRAAGTGPGTPPRATS